MSHGVAAVTEIGLAVSCARSLAGEYEEVYGIRLVV